jgi:hypothetical protein
MFRTSILTLIFAFTSVTVFAEGAQRLTCSGMMRAPRTFPIARNGIDIRASAKGHIGRRPRRDKRALGGQQQNTTEVQDKRFPGRVFPLYRRPILHLQIWPSDEVDVPGGDS